MKNLILVLSIAFLYACGDQKPTATADFWEQSYTLKPADSKDIYPGYVFKVEYWAMTDDDKGDARLDGRIYEAGKIRIDDLVQTWENKGKTYVWGAREKIKNQEDLDKIIKEFIDTMMDECESCQK